MVGQDGRYGRVVDRHQGVIRLLWIVVVAFVVNAVVELVFAPPVVLRWGIALAVVLVVTAVFEAGRRRRAAPANDHDQQ